MKVADVMKKKVISVSPDDNFLQVIKLLINKRISGAPVVNKKGKVVGVISEKDLFYKLFPSEKKFYKNIEYYMNHKNLEMESRKVVKLKVKKLMSKNIISVRSDDHILTACSLLLIHDVRRLPVVDDGKLVGIVTTNNIYKNFLYSLVKK